MTMAAFRKYFKSESGASVAQMLVVLTLTAAVVGAILAFANQAFAPKIAANILAEEKRGIFAVLPGISDYTTIEKEMTVGNKKEVVKIFKGVDQAGNVLGYAFVAAGPGFQGTIKMMVGLNVNKVALMNMEVLDQTETPGLGNKIVDEKFRAQFRNLAIEPRIEYLKNKKPEKPNQIQAITGATISSKAVVAAINNKIAIVLEILKAEGL
jgi:electron transport complex protein RnfG